MKFNLILLLSVVFLTSSFFAQSDNELHFDGYNDYVNLNSISSDMAGLNQWTFEMLVKPTIIQNEEYGVFFSSNKITGDLNRFVLRISGPIDLYPNSVVFNIPVNGVNYRIHGSKNVLDGNCHHVALTYNNGLSKLYIDGELQGNLNYPLNFLSNDRFSLGQEFDEPNFTVSQFYTGTLNEFRIWNQERTLAQVLSLINTEVLGNEPGLIEYFSFNQGVASSNNSSINTLNNQANINNTGNFINFTLNGATSNFIISDCPGCSTVNSSNNVTVCLNETFVFPDGTSSTIVSNQSHISNLLTFDGCDSIITTNVTVLNSSESSIVETLCVGSNYTFPDGSSLNNITSNTIHYSFLQNSVGCDSTITTSLIIADDSCMFYPPNEPTIETYNVFSPNGDGANDVFFVHTTNTTSIELIILNRWGNVIFEETSQNPIWNGKTNSGVSVEDGVYFFRYKAMKPDNSNFEGHGFVHVVK